MRRLPRAAHPGQRDGDSTNGSRPTRTVVYLATIMLTIARIHMTIARTHVGARILASLALCLGVSALLAAAEADDIAEALHLQPGQVVADIGAGDGEIAEALVEVVGEEGRVFATEIHQDLVDKLRSRFADVPNATAVLGTDRTTGLPTNGCDALLLRLVYHHLVAPQEMITEFRRVLRPRGRIAIIDMIPQTYLPDVRGVPDRGGHGVTPEDVIAEMVAAGFTLETRQDEWTGRSERFCLVFRML